MRAVQGLFLACSFLVLPLAGCNDSTPPKLNEEEETIKKNLAKLSPKDREAALAQKYCAVEPENRLGSMGEPPMILLKEQPVFVCCKNCLEEAKADPEKTLARIKKLKEQVKGGL